MSDEAVTADAGRPAAGGATGTPGTDTGGRPVRGGRRLSLAWLGSVPFLAYVAVFLLLPTAIVCLQAFTDAHNRPTLANVRALGEDYVIASFTRSILLSATTALTGALLGGLLAYVIATGNPKGMLRRLTTAACGVLAQFGGVTLAFAFIATIGGEGLMTVFLRDAVGINLETGWLFDMPGLILVYTYFQIPLMVLVFLPALDGIRPQWREATSTLGGTTWDYWRHVAVPLLTPPFLGAMLLLFANAFSAYATAAALVSQGSIIVPLQIRTALTSEVVLGQENFGKALALGMIVVVAVVMTLYSWFQRRTARWLR
ncbi:MAG TPA: ABC transporter permease subunit [Kineosporiaceae bacterium]|nr:ABC transporter permease subunit [Kineosporiaceae bacterium]